MRFLCFGNCFGVFRSLFNFTASKYVFIKDWRLGVILRTLQVAIFTYVLIDIFLKASYLVTEVPTGYVTVWPDGASLNSKMEEFSRQSEAVKEKSLPYCNDPEKYDFKWSGIEHNDFDCAYIDPASLFVNGESQTFLTTSMRVEKMHFYSKDSSGQCMPAERVGEGATLFEGIENSCGYMESKGHFPIMPEDVTLNLIHSYRTSSAIDKKGSLPRTIIRAPNYDGEEQRVESGEQIKIKLSSLLEIAGIDLDKRLNEQDNPARVDHSQGHRERGKLTYPYARLSGLTLHVTFNYYTRRVAPGSHKKATGRHADDIVCLVDVVPQNKWSFVGSDIRHMMNTTKDPLFLTPDMLEEISSSAAGESEFISSQTDIQRNGITIIFSASGSIGKFDISALISALVAGSVLLAVAQVITTYVALYALGISSELYKAFMRETVDWRQEYARYAAQACVAGFAFLKYDKNRSMKLDRKEIFDVLKNLMHKKKGIEDWQLAALADFLMRQGETGTQVQKGRFNRKEPSVENFIDIEEWIDIFTEDKANWPSLNRLIVHEYPDQESRDGVMELLSKSKARSRGQPGLRGVAEEEEEEGEIERDGTPIMTRDSTDLEANLQAPLLNLQDPAAGSTSGPQRRPRASL